MKVIFAIFQWVFRILQLCGPLLPVLFGVSVYGGLAVGMYMLLSKTIEFLASMTTTFDAWAGSFEAMLSSLFSRVEGNSFFMFDFYVLSLDVPFEWVHQLGVGFFRNFLNGLLGVFIGGLEIAIFVVCIYYVRKRLKSLTSYGGSRDSSGFPI